MTNKEKILDILAVLQGQMVAISGDFQGKMDTLKRGVARLNNNLDKIASQLDNLLEGQRAILEMLTPRSRVDEAKL